ncbi:hypothetical protein FKO01_04100 [Mesorhizobium sp. B2-3-3]|nr:hypothetical protein FKO01_04100 [Mesorhizobium sp. B2-3-3]
MSEGKKWKFAETLRLRETWNTWLESDRPFMSAMGNIGLGLGIFADEVSESPLTRAPVFDNSPIDIAPPRYR